MKLIKEQNTRVIYGTDDNTEIMYISVNDIVYKQGKLLNAVPNNFIIENKPSETLPSNFEIGMYCYQTGSWSLYV